MNDSRNDTTGVCVTYRRERYNKWVSLWDDWKPLDVWTRPWRYYVGNCRTFGFWCGVRSNVCLTSPLINRLLNWKYRNARLIIPGLEDQTDEE